MYNVTISGMEEQGQLSREKRINTGKTDALNILQHLDPDPDPISLTNIHEVGKFYAEKKSNVRGRPTEQRQYINGSEED